MKSIVAHILWILVFSYAMVTSPRQLPPESPLRGTLSPHAVISELPDAGGLHRARDVMPRLGFLPFGRGEPSDNGRTVKLRYQDGSSGWIASHDAGRR